MIVTYSWPLSPTSDIPVWARKTASQHSKADWLSHKFHFDDKKLHWIWTESLISQLACIVYCWAFWHSQSLPVGNICITYQKYNGSRKDRKSFRVRFPDQMLASKTTLTWCIGYTTTTLYLLKFHATVLIFKIDNKGTLRIKSFLFCFQFSSRD